MEIFQNDLEESIIYNLDELNEQTEFPVKFICESIITTIKQEHIIDDNERLGEVYLGVDEIVKDVEVHGDELSPRWVKLRRVVGGFVIETYNRAKAHSESNGFGKIILEQMFGDDFFSEKDNDEYKNFLYIYSGLNNQTYLH